MEIYLVLYSWAQSTRWTDGKGKTCIEEWMGKYLSTMCSLFQVDLYYYCTSLFGQTGQVGRYLGYLRYYKPQRRTGRSSGPLFSLVEIQVEIQVAGQIARQDRYLPTLRRYLRKEMNRQTKRMKKNGKRREELRADDRIGVASQCMVRNQLMSLCVLSASMYEYCSGHFSSLFLLEFRVFPGCSLRNICTSTL